MSAPERGRVVISRSGRDKARKLAVLECDGLFALVADGKVRKLETPKRKNLKHLAITNRVLSEQELATNKQLRRALMNGDAAAES